MHQPTDMDIWQGRSDASDGPSALRWHQRIQLMQPSAPHGVALLGFASDEGVQRNEGRPGAVEGPLALRRALANMAWHQTRPVYDGGDILCESDELEAAQDAFGKHVAELLRQGHLPIGLGGGHEMSWGVWQGLASVAAQQSQSPRIGILNLDAHFDLRAGWRANSGTPFRQIAEDCTVRGWDFRYCVLGIAEPANTAALFEHARSSGVFFHLDEEMRSTNLSAIEASVNMFVAEVDWLYLTIDLDVLSATVAPGVSAPASVGVAPEVVEQVVRVAKASSKLRLADVAELNPRFDVDGRTARLAARLVWRLAQ